MSQKSPRYNLYRDFVDAYMKSHFEMTRCVSFQIKKKKSSLLLIYKKNPF